jgi:hypothetical protein
MNIYMSFIKHAAAFGKLVGICAGYEGKYNPAPQNLSISALRVLAEKADSANRSVSLASQLRVTAEGQRRAAFQDLQELTKRLRGEVNNLNCDNGTKTMLHNTLNRMAGYRAGAVLEKPATAGTEPTSAKRSSGMDFHTRLAAFETVISILSSTTGYLPSSESTSITSIQKKMEHLKMLMDQVNTAKAGLAEARSNRKKTFHSAGGVFDTTRNVKNVFMSIFGNPSDELNGIRSVRFN